MKAVYLLTFSVLLSITSYGQDSIYAVRGVHGSYRLVGKTEDSLIYRQQAGANNWQLIGKHTNGQVYHKGTKQDRWVVAGKTSDGLIYRKHRRKDRYTVIGKYENGIVYEKLARERWREIGKYTGNAYCAALLLLFQSDDSGATILVM